MPLSERGDPGLIVLLECIPEHGVAAVPALGLHGGAEAVLREPREVSGELRGTDADLVRQLAQRIRRQATGADGRFGIPPLACPVAESKTVALTMPLRATTGIAGVTIGTGAKAEEATTERDSISLLAMG